MASSGELNRELTNLLRDKAAGSDRPQQIMSLLLTTARIVRAIRREQEDGYSVEDIAALDEALKPFDPSKEIEAPGSASQALGDHWQRISELGCETNGTSPRGRAAAVLRRATKKGVQFRAYTGDIATLIEEIAAELAK